MAKVNIAIMGRAGSGKDTAADRLVAQHAYQRVAFADPLKEMLTAFNPILGYEPAGYGPVPVTLSDYVRRYGWDDAKRRVPAVRRAMQRMGDAVRSVDPRFWVEEALARIDETPHGTPLVVSDVRYPNEYKALQVRGFHMVRIVSRPHAMPMADIRARLHSSENALDDFMSDTTLANASTLDDFLANVDALTR